MSETMAAVVQFDLKPGSVEVREMAIPEIGEDEVLLDLCGPSPRRIAAAVAANFGLDLH